MQTDMVEHVIHMANLNPNGFRTPRRNLGQGPGGLTLVERLTVQAGLADAKDLMPERSARGRRKRLARKMHRETVRRQQAQGLELRSNRKGMG